MMNVNIAIFDIFYTLKLKKTWLKRYQINQNKENNCDLFHVSNYFKNTPECKTIISLFSNI